jgi:hypothetical protein
MHQLTRFGAMIALTFALSNCGASRSAFTPQGGPPTVGMPAKLSERERNFMPEIESALQTSGYVPVRHGAGDLELTFKISEGPINTDTNIELTQGERIMAEGRGRAAGVPLVGRKDVAEKSFQRAFSEFQSALSGVPSGGSSATLPLDDQDAGAYVY